MWKKEYRQFLATGVVVPKAKVAVVRTKVVAALDSTSKPESKPMLGLLSRLAVVEGKLDLLLEKVASLDALWR
jgi:hypothetical protein